MPTRRRDDDARDTDPVRYVPGSVTPPADPRPRLGCAADVFDHMTEFRAAVQEHFVVFDLNARHRIIARRVVHIGTLTSVEAHPREVFRGAISNGAMAIIVAHNHPSGDPTPSRDDLALTARLRDVGELVGIRLLDHVVVAEQGFVSHAERGLL